MIEDSVVQSISENSKLEVEQEKVEIDHFEIIEIDAVTKESTVVQPKVFQCSFCDDNYQEKPLRDEHELFHLKKGSFECKICRKEFNYKYGLYKHCKRFHKQLLLHKCKYCDETFLTIQDAEMHEILHEFKDDYIETAQNSTKIHRKEKSAEDFSTKSNQLTKNVEKAKEIKIDIPENYEQDPLEDVLIKVEQSAKTKAIEDLEKDPLKCHQKSFNCHFCEKSFHLKYYLERHVKSVHINKGSYKCPICQKGCNYKGNLVKHCKKSHPELFVHQCRFCESTFMTSEDAEVHEIYYHKNDFYLSQSQEAKNACSYHN